MRANDKALQNLQEEYTEAFRKDWLLALETLAICGIADGIQIRTASGIERTRLHRIMDKFTQFNAGSGPIVQLLDHTISRTGQRGRLPNIYLLTESGAALLRANGHPDAHACELQDDHAMAHKLCMVDIYLSARKHSLEIQTDRVIPFRDTESIRPDHQVAMKDSAIRIVELEQKASQGTVPRIADSLKQKYKFFASPESAGYSKEVRMVINVPPGLQYVRTCNVWHSVIEMLRDDLGLPNFSLKAISLVDFLIDPEWESETSERWRDLTKITREKTEPDDPKTLDADSRVTKNSKEDLVLLAALQQVIQEEQEHQWLKTIDIYFLDVMLKIYEASHPDSELERRVIEWMPPYGSLILFKSYLDLHPVLRTRLRASLHHNISKWTWSPRTVVHRMQQVIDTFLAYYGWRNSAYLSATAVSTDGSAGSFQVIVDSAGVSWGSFDEKLRKIEALRWVLMALFRYADDLGLGRPRFW